LLAVAGKDLVSKDAHNIKGIVLAFDRADAFVVVVIIISGRQKQGLETAGGVGVRVAAGDWGGRGRHGSLMMKMPVTMGGIRSERRFRRRPFPVELVGEEGLAGILPAHHQRLPDQGKAGRVGIGIVPVGPNVYRILNSPLEERYRFHQGVLGTSWCENEERRRERERNISRRLGT
jgi:hypothetical protein